MSTQTPDETHNPARKEEPNAPVKFLAPGEIRGAATILQQSGREIESQIVGQSMGRSIPPGSTIRITCDVAPTTTLGAVVAVLGGPTVLFAHRLVAQGIGRGKRYCLTRGDNAYVCDAPVLYEDLLGVVTHAKHGDSWVPVPAFRSKLGVRAVRAVIQSSIELALTVDVRIARSLVRVWFSFDRIQRSLRHRHR